jgi:hypothetical protein
MTEKILDKQMEERREQIAKFQADAFIYGAALTNQQPYSP